MKHITTVALAALLLLVGLAQRETTNSVHTINAVVIGQQGDLLSLEVARRGEHTSITVDPSVEVKHDATQIAHPPTGQEYRPQAVQNVI